MAEITPIVLVTDIKVNIDYLIKTLGFKPDYITADGTTAVLNNGRAMLMLQAKIGDEPPVMPEDFAEIQVRVEDIEGIYKRAISTGAIIRRYLECTKNQDDTTVWHFTVALPEGHSLTFVQCKGL